jgi:hypothetical protein
MPAVTTISRGCSIGSRLRYTALLTVWLLICGHSLFSQLPARGYQLQSVFLFHFTQFVEWPETSFASDTSPLIIGVLGKNPFGDFLEQAVADEKVDTRPVVVKYYKSQAETAGCHILFLNVERDKIPGILRSLSGKHILTVSDRPDFARQGGMIYLFMRDNKIKIQVNIEACKKSELVVSSKLLRLAEIVGPPENNN